MSGAIDRYRTPLMEAYRKDFEQHTLTEEGDGRWLCRGPDKSALWFRVITAPGTVIVTGDIGEQVLRIHDSPLPWLRGVVSPKHKTIDYSYFAEKCAWTPKRYLPELASEHLDALEAGSDDPEPIIKEGLTFEELRALPDHLRPCPDVSCCCDAPHDYGKADGTAREVADSRQGWEEWKRRQTARENQAGAIRDAVNGCDDGQERVREFYKAWYEATKDPEPPDPTDWDSEIFLMAEALRCFIRLLDEHR